MSETEYLISFASPTPEEYLALRQAAGLATKTSEATELGLRGSWFGVTARKGGQAVGMGRLVGDGGLYFLLCDLAVHPDHRGQSLGKRILAALTEHLEQNALASAFAVAVTNQTGEQLYREFGFELTNECSLALGRTF
ncbi:MAG: GNAT family N-acetyltransferase [Candidatus Dormibacteraeota bacterium]|uniref:GNAT family N-acetyltransferase n=1 Tax=Candidatus Dormiibacter inghamiae TaxID=3127013 RepID=A0A934KCU5_9BACT|nr:GNAT family N-acetyltransferase [Candidatus Dormibacteraeota bacterium]MBJ7606952.1 GNAT family N-acetyltransferase [Candidatus Dormibacteraeota bacterium]